MHPSSAAPPLPRYALVTPARNEAALIEGTILSMLAQTHRPMKWVIVSDGSTDGTDEIVQRHARAHAFIEFVRTPDRTVRDFAGKVHAIRAGLARLEGIDYDVVGNLDADITFEPDYFEFLLARFRDRPRLGVGGTPFREGTKQYDYRFTSIEHVSGACQLFRRACFEEIGGYRPIKGGGIDWVAVTTARMRGWETRTFTEKACIHNRAIGTAEHDELRARFRQGAKDYRLGGHPLFQLLRSVYQMSASPYLIGGAALLAGYLHAMLTRAERAVDPELLAFHRAEQMRRLRRLVGLGRPRMEAVAR